MLLRKINAGFSLISMFLIMDHAIFHAAWMLSRGSIPKTAGYMPWILVCCMAIHAFISIDLAISAHVGIEKRKCKSYPKLNVSTNVQRASGILMILFTALHIAGTTGVLTPPQAVHAILPPVFFAVSLAHVAVSTSNALITLGIGNVKFVKIVDALVKILCIVTLVADVIGFYLYLV